MNYTTTERLLIQMFFITERRINELGEKYGDKVVTFLKNIDNKKEELAEKFNLEGDLFNEHALLLGLFENELNTLLSRNRLFIYDNPLKINIFPVGDNGILAESDRTHELSDQVIELMKKYEIDPIKNINDVDFD